MESHQAVSRFSFKAENSHFQLLHLSHEAAKSMANLDSQSCGDLQAVQPSSCLGEMEPFTDHLSVSKCLTSLRNKPQQK